MPYKDRERQRAANREAMRRLRSRRREAKAAAGVRRQPAAKWTGADLAERLVEFLGQLEVSEGRRAGDRFEVLPWQREFVRGAFADGIGEAALSVARGNGKSTLVGGLAAASLVGPLAGRNRETVVVAASVEQGRCVFRHAREFLRPWIEAEPARWRVVDSPLPRIEDRRTGARLVVRGSDPARAHGMSPSLALLDEPAQWERGTADRMLAALRTAAGKQVGCRLIALGTRAADDGHWFGRMLRGGPGRFAACYAADAEADVREPATWAAANPSLAAFPDLRAAIGREAEEAVHDPATLAAFRALRLNAGVADTVSAVLLEVRQWRACEVEELPPADGLSVWGVDLGSGSAQSAVVAYWPATGRMEALAAFPGEPVSLAERGLRDGVGGEYVRMQEEGSLILLPGRVVEVARLIEEASFRFGWPEVVAADRWRAAELRTALDRSGLAAGQFAERGQGFRDGGEDVRAFRRAVLRQRVRALPRLLTRAAFREARTVSDPAGNAKLAKRTEGGRRDTARDDVAAAAILAVAEGSRRAEVDSGPSWRSLGVV